MLNEKKEYKLYSSVFQNNPPAATEIIKKRNLDNGLSGIKHILEIIARGKIEESTPHYDLSQIEKDLVTWLECFKSGSLHVSCSNCKKRGNKDCPKHCNNQDPIYWKISSLQGTGKHNPFRLDGNNGKDFNAIYFKSIIADAYESGSLQEYALLSKQDFFNKKSDSCVRKHSKKSQFQLLSPGEVDYILKLTATFLLKQQQLKAKGIEIHSLRITDSDVLNWSVLDRIDCEDFVFKENYKGKGGNSLYIRVPLTYSDSKYFKLKFDRDWLDNFRIINLSKDNPTQYKDVYPIMYLDNGIGKKLESKEL